MTFAEKQWAALVSHHATHSDATRGIDVRVHRERPDTLVFQYVLRAEMSRIRIPPLELPGRADGLWKHTCFEAFIAATDVPGYYELNFSPSQQWAVYRFTAYRDGMSPADIVTPPQLTVRRYEDRLEVDAMIRLFDLTTLQAARTLKLALSAVVEDDSGTLSYWALKHAPDKPDFHHSNGFVLKLPT
jgi:hypothetical protein